MGRLVHRYTYDQTEEEGHSGGGVRFEESQEHGCSYDTRLSARCARLRRAPLLSTLLPSGFACQPVSFFRSGPAALKESLPGAVRFFARSGGSGRLAELLRAADRREAAG